MYISKSRVLKVGAAHKGQGTTAGEAYYTFNFGSRHKMTIYFDAPCCFYINASILSASHHSIKTCTFLNYKKSHFL